MTTTATETWASRDLPFLRALVAQLERTPRTDVSATDIGQDLSLDETDTLRALRNLKRGEYVVERPGPRRQVHKELTLPLDVTDKALYAVGAWPDPQTAADRLLTAFEKLAADAPDEPTRTRARTVLEQVGGFSRDTVAAIAATVITGQLPGAGS